ncbi:MAG: uL13 family ribosomal protein [Candidatus Nomurabacteria bacterium]|nr:uL13 family ribosomal protein [Candidatus Nomurabacteria bacterium]
MKKETTQINTTVEPKVIDASGKVLGRVATEAAMHLMGKTSAKFERNVFSGLPVKIINAGALKITGKKLAEIQHTRYSGYPGGLRVIKGKETAEKKGLKELIKLAIYQMLPDNKLRRKMMVGLEITD